MYRIIAVISVLIRQFFIANPYESLSFLNEETATWLPIVLNLLTEGIFHAVAFGIVGIFYRSRSCPAWGSLLYLVVYWINIGVLTLLCKASFSLFYILIILSVYISAILLLKKIQNRFVRTW